MGIDWVRYEARALGWLGLAMPPLVLVVFGGLAWLVGAADAPAGRVGRVVTAGLELGLPLAAGFVAATLIAEEDAVELHLSLPTRYPVTVVRRLGLLTAWSGGVALLAAVAAEAAGLWEVPGSFLVGQLGWLAPLLWFVAVGAALALLLGGRAASAALLGGVWAIQNLFAGFFEESGWLRPLFLFATTYAPGADFWLANRLSLIGIAALAAVGGWLLLHGGEALLAGEDG